MQKVSCPANFADWVSPSVVRLIIDLFRLPVAMFARTWDVADGYRHIPANGAAKPRTIRAKDTETVGLLYPIGAELPEP
jgi:hypothetical protein